MTLPKWTGVPLHVLGGAAITVVAILLGFPGFLAFLFVTFAGWAREKIQHLPLLDPLTLHQHLEAWAWGVGSLVSWQVMRWLL